VPLTRRSGGYPASRSAALNRSLPRPGALSALDDQIVLGPLDDSFAGRFVARHDQEPAGAAPDTRVLVASVTWSLSVHASDAHSHANRAQSPPNTAVRNGWRRFAGISAVGRSRS
jgi:hypothetical protein